MGEKATSYIENIKKNNAEKAKERKDAFLIKHGFIETTVDENGNKVIVPETVTDEEYNFLADHFYKKSKAEKKEAPDGSLCWYVGFGFVIAAFALFGYLFKNNLVIIAFPVGALLLANAFLFFAISNIQERLYQISSASKNSEKLLEEIAETLKEIERDKNRADNNSQ